MMIIKQRKDDDYCIVHGTVHRDIRHYELCDYCLLHKYWMYPRTVYYRHGFAKKDVLICDDCHKIESEFYEFRLVAVTTEYNAYEAICHVIKHKTSPLSSSSSFLLHNQQTQEQGNGNVSAAAAINYYDAVRIAYQNSEDVREYLRCAIEDINKDLPIIWKFTYRKLNFERRIKVVNKDVDNLLVSWIKK
jgi:hypothetical protein